MQRAAPRGGPVMGERIVARHRLFARLRPALRVGAVRVSGAAGSGKTTLLATWLDTLPSSVRTLWLTLRPEHNDSAVLADDMVSLLRGTRLAPEPLGMGGSLESILRDVLEPASGSQVVLVLDDMHVIDSESVTDAISSVLGQVPDGSCMVVSGRADPGLHWATMRARRALIEVREGDLRFDEAETGMLFRDVFGVDVGDWRVAGAVSASEGWAAGLVLTGATMQAKPRALVDVSVSPHHRQSIDAFIDEAVLANCSPDVREFLRLTAVLPVLDPSLCNVLTGREDSASVLRQLSDRNMLTEELAGPSPTFRYHGLLRQALRRQTGQEELHLLSARVEGVVEALARQGRLVEATDLALDAGQASNAEMWIRRAVGPALARGYAATVVRWLSTIPTERLRSQPDLLLVLARAAGVSGDPITAKAAVLEVRRLTEHHTASTGLRIGLQLLETGIGLWEGKLTTTISSLRELLTLIPDDLDDPVLDLLGHTQASVRATLAGALLMEGQLDEAVDVADGTVDLHELEPLTRHAVVCLGVRALAGAWAGHDRESAAAVEAAMPLVGSWRPEVSEAVLFWAAAAWVGPQSEAEQNLAAAHRLSARASVPLLKALPAVTELRVRQRLGQHDRVPAAAQRAKAALAEVPEPGYLAEVLRNELHRIRQQPGPPPDLSGQELAMLQGLSRGYTRREVAEQMHFSVNTVKTHLRSAYRKLGANDRAQALTQARAWGLLDQDAAAPIPRPPHSPA